MPDADQEAVLDDELAAAADGRMRPPDLAQIAAVAVEHMDPGPAQAAWLETAAAAAGRLDEDALAGLLIASQQAGFPGCTPPGWPPPRRSPPGPLRLTAGSAWRAMGGRCGCAATRRARSRWR